MVFVSRLVLESLRYKVFFIGEMLKGCGKIGSRLDTFAYHIVYS